MANQPFLVLPKDYEIYGNDIDGFAGKASLIFQEDGQYYYKISD
jgi:hypothetical protein